MKQTSGKTLNSHNTNNHLGRPSSLRLTKNERYLYSPNVCQLAPLLRFYIYGLHGFLIEVIFTAVWDFILNQNWKLPGVTSVWAFFIYAVAGLSMERLYFKYLKHNVLMPIRGIIYLIVIYSDEFVSGWLLRYFDACPWNYTGYTWWNIQGLIALDYAPLWFLASLLTEQLLLENILKVQWGSQSDDRKYD